MQAKSKLPPLKKTGLDQKYGCQAIRSKQELKFGLSKLILKQVLFISKSN